MGTNWLSIWYKNLYSTRIGIFDFFYSFFQKIKINFYFHVVNVYFISIIDNREHMTHSLQFSSHTSFVRVKNELVSPVIVEAKGKMSKSVGGRQTSRRNFNLQPKRFRRDRYNLRSTVSLSVFLNSSLPLPSFFFPKTKPRIF